MRRPRGKSTTVRLTLGVRVATATALLLLLGAILAIKQLTAHSPRERARGREGEKHEQRSVARRQTGAGQKAAGGGYSESLGAAKPRNGCPVQSYPRGTGASDVARVTRSSPANQQLAGPVGHLSAVENCAGTLEEE